MAEWYSDWDFRKKITIDYTKIDADLTDFPVLVSLGTANFDFDKSNTDGHDIRFTDSSGTALLSYERERHDYGNSLAEYWTKIPSIGSASATEFYVYYTAEDKADGAEGTAVWDSNFKMVQHLNDITTSTIEDSTSNDLDGAKKEAEEPIEADGKIAKAQDFDGSDDYVSLVSHEYPQTFTFSVWVYLDAYNSGAETYVLSADDEGGNRQFRFVIAGSTDSENTGKMRFIYNVVGASSVYSDSALSTGQWYLCTVVKSGTTLYFYLNESLDGSPTGGNIGTGACTADIGGKSAGSGSTIDGKLDELRYSDSVRNIAWVKASYNSGNLTLLTFGIEETPPPIVGRYQPQNVVSYSYNDFEDNRPTQWRALLGNVRGFRVDLFTAADEFQTKRDVVDATGTTTYLLFRGPIENIIYESSRQELELSGRGMEQLLARYYTNQHPDGTATGRLIYTQNTVEYIVEDILRGTPISVGSIDSIFTTSTASFRFDFVSRLEAINQIAESYGARYWVDEDRQLWFMTSRGGGTASMWFRDEIQVSNKTVDYTNLINKLTVLGKGDGIHQLKANVERTSSQDSYGIRAGVETRRDLIDENVLIEYGEKLIDITSEPQITFEVSVPWTPLVNVGDYVKVTDKRANLDGFYKIVELRASRDSEGRDDLKLVMSNKAGRFEQLALWAKLRVLEKSARGSALVHLFPSTITSGTYAETEIYVPEETEEITGSLFLDACLINVNWTAGTISVYVDDEDRSSALGGPWGTSPQADIDVTQWISDTGWHKIKTLSNDTGDIKMLVKTRLYSHAY